ncbi:MAG: anthranilate phosphoribosyltransferase [SAR202 cluster bacterium]|nr:anthranilate phosphoribosyltransferase [SAR202 cluster bacterium]|tara:strand:+ start:7026 stop:8072 length:1047 start_codon:yes stop_codon:yes gene_type:complete
MNIKTAIKYLVQNKDLSEKEAQEVMFEIMTDKVTPAQFGSFITALKIKGETAFEIAGMAKAMRSVSLKIDLKQSLLDTCGTGGSGLNWFNISTACAFVISGAGIKIAKHGNKAISGKSGSADVLSELGVNISLKPEQVKRCIEDIGIGFLFAQTFHPAMKFAGPLRPQIGIPTIFNFLGPLTNPANASNQVLGVSNIDFVEKIAKALEILGTKYSFVVHSESGADEIDVEGNTLVYQINQNGIKRRKTRAADFGLPEGRREHLIIDDISQSSKKIKKVLAGEGRSERINLSEDTSCRNIVIMNAAAGIISAGKANAFQEAAEIAKDSIDSGNANKKLEELIKISQELS